MLNYTEGPLVQVDEERNALLGTPLTRALHTALLKGGAQYDEATNAFVFSSPIMGSNFLARLNEMAALKAFPIGATFAESLDKWYPELGGRAANMLSTVGRKANEEPKPIHSIVFSDSANFFRALKGLAKLEDTVHMEPTKLIMDRNAVNVRGNLQDLGVVYLAKIDAYIAMLPGKEAEIHSLIAEASLPTPIQCATIFTADKMTSGANQFDGQGKSFVAEILGDTMTDDIRAGFKPLDIDRFQASAIIAQLNDKFGPMLQAEVTKAYPDIVKDTEASLNSARIEKVAARTAKFMAANPDVEVTETGIGALKTSATERFMAETAKAAEFGLTASERETRDEVNLRLARENMAKGISNAAFDKSQVQKLETDHFEEKEKGNKTSLDSLPITELHPKAQQLAALGVVLRELHENGEATFKDWRLATPGEVVFAPVATQNSSWIIQRTDKGVGVIHDTAILSNLETPRQQLTVSLARTMLNDIPVTEDNVAQLAQFNEIAKSIKNTIESEAALKIARELLGSDLSKRFNMTYPGYSEKQKPEIVEDLRLPITLGTDALGNTVLQQPEQGPKREVNPDVAWAMGTDPSSERLNKKEQIEVGKQEKINLKAQRDSVKNYLLSNETEAQKIATAELVRRGIDPTRVKFRAPEPTRAGEHLPFEVLGFTRDNSHIALQMLPTTVSRPVKVVIIQAADLGMGTRATGDLRKGDKCSFGLERLHDQLIPYGFQRIPNQEQAASLVASQAASVVNLSKAALDRVPKSTLDRALQKFTEWHRGSTGFEPHTAPVVVDPEVGVTYSGPIVEFAGKYTIQSLQPEKDGTPRIVLHDTDMVLPDQKSFLRANSMLTMVYRQSEMGQVAPLTITDARPMKDGELVTEEQLTKEIFANNPDLEANVQKGLGQARATQGTKGDQSAALKKYQDAQWDGGL